MDEQPGKEGVGIERGGAEGLLHEGIYGVEMECGSKQAGEVSVFLGLLHSVEEQENATRT